ncbi:RHS repeat-associated core domain-containing protein [Nocardioides panacisoli]|uniref:Intein C-terminal splicing domain-containing protein n=1 Tax=Nocardioides panacisoli TaxID=627624 RepID=A0ABP7HRQ2_9ACTN
MTFDYYASGQLHTITANDGATVTYGYTNGLLTSVTDPNNKTTTYDYYASNQLHDERDPLNKTVVQLAYDPTSMRVTDEWDARNKHTTFAWNSVAEKSTVTAPNGGKWIDDYDDGVLARRVDPLRRVWSYSYDAKLQLRSVRDPRGTTTEMVYSPDGDMIASTGVNGRVETAYNAAHDPVETTDANGVVTDFGYDTAGNLKTLTRTLPVTGKVLTETYGVDARGLLTSYKDGRGKLTLYGYDSFGDLRSTTSPEGRISTYTYFPNGELKTQVDPGGNVTTSQLDSDATSYTTTYTYDADGRPKAVSNPIIGTASTTYYDNGLLHVYTDAKNRDTTYGYDDAGHVTSIQGPDSSLPAATATYDDDGNLKTTTDTAGRTITYGYDVADQPTTAVGPTGSYVYTYDKGGNLATAALSGTNPTKFDYDPRGALKSINYDSVGTADVTYAYDIHGNRKTMVDAAGTVNYGYTPLDQLASVSRAGGPTFTYGYDDAGNLATANGPNGNLGYTYTDDGQLDTVSTTPTGGTKKVLADYDYNHDLSTTTATLGNGATWKRDYDAAGRLTGIMHMRPGGQVILDEDYALDAAGNPSSITHAEGSTATTDTNTYDVLDQLTAVCYGATSCSTATDYVKWTYDAGGNRKTETRPAGTTTYTYNPTTARLDSWAGPSGSASYLYDAYGRPRTQTSTPTGGSSTTTTYVYNEANQLQSATTGTPATSYAYDGDGRRLTSTKSDGTVTSFAWDPLSYQLAAQTTTPAGGGAGTTKSYQYGLGLIGTTTDNPVTTAATYKYVHTDPQGNIRAVTDASGALVGRRSWEPFGLSRGTDTDPGGTGFGWGGQVTNGDGTMHLRARAYDPTTGRFAIPDPAASTSGSSTYTYAGNNPMVNSDPYGLFDLNGFLDTVGSVAPTVATVAGIGAMIFPPAAPILGPIALGAGALTAASSAYNAYEVCTSDKGGCGAAIGQAAFDFGSLLPLGRLAGPLERSMGRTGEELLDDAAHACSFEGDTLVLMADGSTKPISKIRVGDKVLATDPGTGQQRAERVEKVFVHWDTITDLKIGGEVISTTRDHPFWSSTDGEFERADNLSRGETVLGLGLDPTPVVDGFDGTSARWSLAYNLQVHGIHTYHVGAAAILVHNTCELPAPGKGPGAVPPSERDPRRLFSRPEVQDQLEQQGGTCLSCGDPLDLAGAKGHHGVRHADGGSTTLDNLFVLCGPCHTQIHR